MNDRDDEAAIAMRSITTFDRDIASNRIDTIAIEAPLELRIGETPLTVLMRTPGNDEELAHGFLFTEGVITDADELIAIRRPLEASDPQFGNVISVELHTSRKNVTNDRNFFSSSSCGICGKSTLESLQFQAAVSASMMTIHRDLLAALPDKLRQGQALFAKTGGVHASGLFDNKGNLIAIREDVGRHNALDKLIGWGLIEGKVPFENAILLVSGRVSYEIIQKAAMAGFAIIAAVGAPSSLAIDLADKFNITLIGFVRNDSMNIYSAPSRIDA